MTATLAQNGFQTARQLIERASHNLYPISERLRPPRNELRTEIADEMRRLSEKSEQIRTVEKYAQVQGVLAELRAVLYRTFGDQVDYGIRRPGREELIDLTQYQRMVITEPSSGVVAQRYVEMVLAEVAGQAALHEESVEAIESLGEILVAERPYPAKRLVRLVRSKLDSPIELAEALRTELEIKQDVSERLARRFELNHQELGFAADASIVVYGFSQTIYDLLERVPTRTRPSIHLLVASCSARPAQDMPMRLLKRAEELRYSARIVPDIELFGEFALVEGNRTGQHLPPIKSLLMGCKVIGISPDGHPEFVTTHGSRAAALLAGRADVPVTIVAGSYKTWRQSEYLAEVQSILEEQRPGLTLPTDAPGSTVAASDILESDLVAQVLTEHGLFRPDELLAKYRGRLT